MTDNMNTTRLYHLYHSFWRHDYDVTTADKSPLYHVDNSSWTPKKPDLTLHHGTENKAPIVASCKYTHFSRHSKISLGNPDDPNQVQWEDFICQGYTHGKYRWQLPMRNKGERPSFIWKRTSSVGVQNSSPSMFSQGNFKLMDERTNGVVAVYSSSAHKSLDKSGKLEIYGEYGPDFDVMVLITALGMIEKNRRRNSSGGAASGAAAGAGGGGGC